MGQNQVTTPAGSAAPEVATAEVRLIRPRSLPARRLPARPAGRLLPNLMVVGVTHAGAGDLVRQLARHREIKRSITKRIDLYDPMRYDRPPTGTTADYDRHFGTWTGQRYRLENAPTYFDGGPELVRALARDLPDLRILILLRDPAARLWDGYRDKIASGRLPRAMSYPTYVERCLALRVNGAERFEANRYFRTLSSGLYTQHLGRWFELFGDRARVVFSEHLLADPEGTAAQLRSWLGLDPPSDPPTPSVALRPSHPTGHDGLQRFGEQAAPSAVGRLWASVAEPARSAGRSLLRTITDDPSSRPPRSRADGLYRRANRELADQLRAAGHRDLPPWAAR